MPHLTQDDIDQETAALRRALTTSFTERSKTTMPAKSTSPTVAIEGNTLDAAIDAADLRVSEIDRVYKMWGSQGLKPALQLVTRLKEASVKLKQAPPDPIEQAIERLRTAAHAAGQVARDDELVQQIDALAAAFGRLTTQAGQRLDAQMKAAGQQAARVEAELARTARLFSDDGRPLVRPLRDEHGNPLP